MRLFKREQKAEQFETVLQRLVSATSGMIGYVTPETCMKAPTVQAIVTAVSRRIQSTPVHVYQTTMDADGKETKKRLPHHDLEKLLKKPNEWQSAVDYWADLASSLVRYGRYIAIKGQGGTGPVRVLTPVVAEGVTINQDETTRAVTFQIGNQVWPMSEVHYIRGPAKDYLRGDSPVDNIKTAIGLEIACEEYGATFFENGALPLMIFRYMAGKSGYKDPTDEKKFVADFQEAFSGKKRHKAFLLPAGMEEPSTPKVENDKAQFTETRKYNQTVIAGAWNIPPHLVGNLENAHYNNVEQQDKDFTLGVIMPYIVSIEAAMDRDLLTDADRENGISARFNMDASLRADYLSRMQGYEIQIRNAMKTPNECREREGENPSTDQAADATYYSANLKVSGEIEGSDDDSRSDDDDDDNWPAGNLN